MDATFLVPLLNELAAAIGRGLERGFVAELARPTPSRAPGVVRGTAPGRVTARRAPRRPGSAAAEPGLTAPPAAGDVVRYRQGRGAFDAIVVDVDAGRGVATVERLGDRRRVARPFAKLSPGAAAEVSAPAAEPVAPPPPAPAGPPPGEESSAS